MSSAPPILRLPNFVIIGAMKSATSSLHMQLTRQPGIFMCTPKEPNFFSDDEHYAKGMAWYGGLFAGASPASLLGEASTHYTKLPRHPHAIKRLKKHLPDARFVYVMRHPVDRLISHYIHEWSTGAYRCGIDEALDKYPELTSYGCYARQLKPYFESFGRDAVLPVFFDHLLSAPQLEFERICRFIGYAGTPVWSEEAKPDNVSRERVRKFPGYAWLVESAPATWLRRHCISQNLRDVLKKKLSMQTRPTLSQPSRTRLESALDSDLAQLGQWLGTDLTCQNFKQITSARPLDWVLQNEQR